MTRLAVSTGAPAETLPREWWPDRWGHQHESGILLYCGQIIYPISLLRGQILFSVCLARFDLFNQWVVTGDSRRPGPWHHVLTSGAWGCLMELHWWRITLTRIISGGDCHNVFWSCDCCDLRRWRQSSIGFEVRMLSKKRVKGVLFNFLFDISRIANSLSLDLSI